MPIPHPAVCRTCGQAFMESDCITYPRECTDCKNKRNNHSEDENLLLLMDLRKCLSSRKYLKLELVNLDRLMNEVDEKNR